MIGSNPRLIFHNQPLLTKFERRLPISLQDLSCTNYREKKGQHKARYQLF